MARVTPEDLLAVCADSEGIEHVAKLAIAELEAEQAEKHREFIATEGAKAREASPGAKTHGQYN